MEKKIKLELTVKQFDCLVDIIDTMDSLVGVGGDFDTEQNRNIKMLNNMLKKNGYKRV